MPLYIIAVDKQLATRPIFNLFLDFRQKYIKF